MRGAAGSEDLTDGQASDTSATRHLVRRGDGMDFGEDDAGYDPSAKLVGDDAHDGVASDIPRLDDSDPADLYAFLAGDKAASKTAMGPGRR